MKKIAIVAALAALSASAFAQSSVTLWGRINTSVESIKEGTGSRAVKMVNNNSRLGFKGQEDLGGGLKASFALEHGLNSDNGAATGGTTFWNREASVQLAGEFGAVRLGKWTAGSYFATADYVSMHNHDTGTSEDKLQAVVPFLNGNNKVGYFTPNIDGFTGEVAVSLGEGTNTRLLDLAANYDQGPLHLGAGYSKYGSAKQFGLRALYEMGQFTFGGYWQRETAMGTSRNIGRLAVAYTEGANEFHFNIGGTKAGAYQGLAGAKQYTLAYNHNLSKRTKLYGFYTAVDSKINANDLSSLGAGIRHNF